MALAGLILHASRCGSTLLLAALGTWPDVVTVDEPPELDAALTQVRSGGDPALVGAVLARLAARADRVIVKTDAWHALELPRLRAVAPDVPWLFVHRDPAEILVSHAREPGSHTVPGVLPQVWFGPPRTVYPLPYAASVLAAIFVAITPYAGARNLVDHADLPAALRDRVPAHFGLGPEAADLAALAQVLGRHAKRPHEPYRDDRPAKRRAVTAEIAALAAGEAGPAYRALLRTRQVAA